MTTIQRVPILEGEKEGGYPLIRILFILYSAWITPNLKNEKQKGRKMSLKRKKLEEFYYKVEERVYNLEQWSRQFTMLKNDEENKNMREKKRFL